MWVHDSMCTLNVLYYRWRLFLLNNALALNVTWISHCACVNERVAQLLGLPDVLFPTEGEKSAENEITFLGAYSPVCILHSLGEGHGS